MGLWSSVCCFQSFSPLCYSDWIIPIDFLKDFLASLTPILLLSPSLSFWFQLLYFFLKFLLSSFLYLLFYFCWNFLPMYFKRFLSVYYKCFKSSFLRHFYNSYFEVFVRYSVCLLPWSSHLLSFPIKTCPGSLYAQ